MRYLNGGVFLVILTLTACGSAEKATTSVEKDDGLETKETLYVAGHSWYSSGRHDSATIYLERSRSLDPSYAPPLRDLAEIYYASSLTGIGEGRVENMRSARGCYAKLDSLGHADEAVYDRLTELSHGLGDSRMFLLYSEKQVRLFPGDRQLYNLGLAYFRNNDFQKVIETQKEAIGEYPHSPYAAGFYRLLGDGYYNVDRQQTAERTYEEGVRVVAARAKEMKDSDPKFTATQEFRQMADNYDAMVASLKKIYRLHGKHDKLRELENRPDLDP
jgi:tetratricopeptide (TPR) repeat protein